MVTRSSRRRPDRAGGGSVLASKEANASLVAPPPPPPPPPPPLSSESSPPLPPTMEYASELSFPHISTGIYAAPTVDTLEDETVASFRMNAFSVTTSATTVLHASSRLDLSLHNNLANPPPESPSDHQDQTPLRKNFAPADGGGANTISGHALDMETPPPPVKSLHYLTTTTTQRMDSLSPPRHYPHNNIYDYNNTNNTITTTLNSKVPRDFLREEDAMTVTIQNVNIAQRSAFDLQRPPSLAYWHAVAQEAERNLLATSPVLLSRSGIRKKRLSPSFQHLQLLHKMQSVTTIQQLNFSPSVGLEADPFVPWDDTYWSSSEPQQQQQQSSLGDNEKLPSRRNRQRRQKRDGRYRSIHPVQATLAQLPSTPPFVSNKKMRLPSRADVGFSNPSQDDVARKHQEIIHETEWEEASPRLIVLIPSDDIGTFVPSVTAISPANNCGGGPSRILPECGLPFGLEGMPWAGPELIMAKERNTRHFGGTTHRRSQQQLFAKRTSMLAPPLDATYSSTLGWRPRPFHDRHPGIAYFLAACIQVQFDAGNLEPILASLTLYSLPTATQYTPSIGPEPKRKQGVYGKMSEEFYFPAGDWRGKIQLDLARLGDNNDDMDPELLESFHKRKHKALFSYDPQCLAGGKQSLHLVLQLYKVTHADALGAYAAGNATAAAQKGERRSSLRNRIKDKLKGKSTTTTGEDTSAVPPPSLADMTSARANTAFENYGTQFLTPLGFGVIPMYHQDSVGDDRTKSMSWPKSWPNGETKQTPIFAFPAIPESQEEFIERLALTVSSMSEKEQLENIAVEGEQSLNAIGSTFEPTLDQMKSSSTLSTMSLTSVDSSNSISPTPSKKVNVARRIFNGQRKPSLLAPILSAPDRRAKEDSKGGNKDNRQLAAKATVFVSELDVDFLQSMLFTPPELETGEDKKGLPKLLVDVSGDSAIMLNPSWSSIEGNRKRSSLVRLPYSEEPCGYAEASEIREVLHLPPRGDKQYDVDSPPPYRAILNLLYLYPRLLRLRPTEGKSDESSKRRKENTDTCRYTVRIRLVQNSLSMDASKEQVESLNTSLEAFHNPAPWAGPSMLYAVYTKVSSGLAGRPHNHAEILKHGIPMKDEIKMRLPSVLDGSYYLQFTLFAVELAGDVPDDTSSVSTSDESLVDDCILSVTAIAESTIPLSSATRDPTSGTRVTTIIPNGCHRLKLGDFQMHMETRVVSSIHVGDPAVATALRDFPIALPEFEEGAGDSLRELALVPSRSIVGKSMMGSNPIVDLKLPYTALFSASSDSTLIGQFHLILFMHLCNLVDRITDSDLDDPPSPQFLLDNMRSLFEVVRKVKRKLRSLPGPQDAQRRIDKFFKMSLDSFDEGLITNEQLEGVDDESTDGIVDQVHLDRSRSNHSANNIVDEDNGDDDADDPRDEGAVRLRHKDSIRHGVDIRISKSVSAIGAMALPFLRVAYGVTKSGGRRMESDLSRNDVRLTHLFDDDVTVSTALMSLTDLPKMQSSHQESTRHSSWGLNEDTTVISDEDAQSIIKDPPKDQPQPSVVDEVRRLPRSLGETGLARRVRTAAQVMLAPCVAPSLSAILTPRSPKRDKDPESKHKMGATKQMQGSHFGFAQAAACLCSPGSDADDDGITKKNVVATDKKDVPKSNGGTLSRVQSENRILAFTVDSIIVRKGVSIPMGTGKFLYESVIVLWVHAWFDFLDEPTDADGTGELDGSEIAPKPIPSFDSSDEDGSTIYNFQAHMDVLLPLCLKSFVTRYCKEVSTKQPPLQKLIVDDNHILMLTMHAEILARGLMGIAMSGKNLEDSDRALAMALASAQTVLEFLIGLFSVLHQAHMFVILGRFFKTLRDCETEHLVFTNGKFDFAWTDETLQRVKSARQLRLRAVEKLAVLPNFLALNHPLTQLPPPNSIKLHSQSFPTYQDEGAHVQNSNEHGSEMLPSNGWLANLLSTECLSICALSSEVVVAEAMAQMETQNQSVARSPPNRVSELRKRPGASLKRDDLLMFQSIAIHSITCLHELIFRRHSMDERFQREKSRGRIAALLAPSLFEKSLSSVRWLARMESTHRVRSLWLLCFVYLLQELPEASLKAFVRTYSNPKEFRIHRFIRLLRLSSSTFQSFIEQPRSSKFPPEIENCIAPWLLQESFNTICATIITVVDECVSAVSKFPREQQTMMQGILDLLLHVLTTPQSAVVHLRAVGGAIHALEQFGVSMFLEIAGENLQHWTRIMLSLMNSISLSVRSIAVDFVVSLLASAYRSQGCIDEITIILLSVLPEVVAREIALCSVSGLISSLEHVESSVWPLRRAFADVEDANPLDDDRVDPQLVPLLSVFCRACQAVIDGVFIELRMQGDKCHIVGTLISVPSTNHFIFDADEESLLEAANFFGHEDGALQRIRWLVTLKSLHEAKCQWLEAAEALILAAKTACDSILYLKSIWRPSRFSLWSDSRRSQWLSTVGEDLGYPDRGNVQVMEFAGNFLEPHSILGVSLSKSTNDSLAQPTVADMCAIMDVCVRGALTNFSLERNMVSHAYARLQSLLESLSQTVDECKNLTLHTGIFNHNPLGSVDEEELQRFSNKLTQEVAKLSQQLDPVAVKNLAAVSDTAAASGTASVPMIFFVCLRLTGTKPRRFQESTTVPTFLEWDQPCICRVPGTIVAQVLKNGSGDIEAVEERICREFALPLLRALADECRKESVMLRTGSVASCIPDGDSLSTATLLNIAIVQMDNERVDNQSQTFFICKPPSAVNDALEGTKFSEQNELGTESNVEEWTVANAFPCAFSRQRALVGNDDEMSC